MVCTVSDADDDMMNPNPTGRPRFGLFFSLPDPKHPGWFNIKTKADPAQFFKTAGTDESGFVFYTKSFLQPFDPDPNTK